MVEELLNDVIAGLIVVAEAKRQHEIELERQRKEWAEAERRRMTSNDAASSSRPLSRRQHYG